MTATLPIQTTLATVVALLGGPSLMPQPIQTELDLIRAAAAGVSVKAVRHLQRHMRLPNREMSEMLSISESTLARREQSQQPLSRDESETAIQLSALAAHGLQVFENEPDFHRWLHTDNPALGSIKPQTLLPSALGREQVRELLGRIEWGIFS